MKKRSGYILVLTLLIISLAVGLVTAIVRQSFSYRRQLCSFFDKGRARLLALSSLEIALAQISFIASQESTSKGASSQLKQPPTPSQPADKTDPAKRWAEKVLPYLNRWQTFNFDGSYEGLEGVIRLYIASENGKINIRYLAKPVEQPQGTSSQPAQRVPSAKAPPGPVQPSSRPSVAPIRPDVLTFIDKLFSSDKEVSLKNTLKDFQSRFKRPLEDPSELLHIKNFDKYKSFLFKTPESSERSLFIMDLFTVFTPDVKINPFVLSQSLKKLLGFAESKDSKLLAKNIKSSMNWSTDWDKICAPLYGKTYSSLDPALKDLLTTSFKVTTFSVIAYAKVGVITQRMYAILEAIEPPEGLSPQSFVFRVSRIYWF